LTRRAPSASTQSISCRSRLVQPSSAQPDMLRDHFRSPTNFCRRRRSPRPHICRAPKEAPPLPGEVQARAAGRLSLGSGAAPTQQRGTQPINSGGPDHTGNNAVLDFGLVWFVLFGFLFHVCAHTRAPTDRHHREMKPDMVLC
jgi:hypothetical protein